MISLRQQGIGSPPFPFPPPGASGGHRRLRCATARARRRPKAERFPRSGPVRKRAWVGRGSRRVGDRRAARTCVSCLPSSNRTCGFPASGSPIIFLPWACAAALPDDSPSPPSDTADNVHGGRDSSTFREPFAKYTDVCAGAITASHSVPPNRSCETSGCCCRPESMYTIHSEPGSASG